MSATTTEKQEKYLSTFHPYERFKSILVWVVKKLEF